MGRFKVCYPDIIETGLAHPRYWGFGPQALESHATPGARRGHFLHGRPHAKHYSWDDAKTVVDWLNGQDQPLPRMVPAWNDPWSPAARQKARGLGPFNRKGMTPIRDFH